MRAIDADELSKTIKETCLLAKPWDYVLIEQAIADAPTIEPECKKGRWINHRNDNGHNIADCDKCGEAMQWFDDDIKPNYCPNCGAYLESKE